MVEIPIDDRDFIHTIQSDSRPNGSIVENTKTHCPVRFSMVSWWADNGKTGFTIDRTVHCFCCGTCCKGSYTKSLCINIRARVKEMLPSMRRKLPDHTDI